MEVFFMTEAIFSLKQETDSLVKNKDRGTSIGDWGRAGKT